MSEVRPIYQVVSDFNSLYEEDLNTSNHPSVYIDEGTYELLILRNLEVKEEGLNINANGFLIVGADVYFYQREERGLYLLEKGFQGLYLFLMRLYQKNHSIVKMYSQQVDELEDDLYDRDFPGYFMDIWFDLKKDMARVQRYYEHNIQVFVNFLNKHKKSKPFPTSEFKDIKETIYTHMALVNTMEKKLDGLHHYYNSIKQDRLNKNIYILTLISAVFLPLNLIVGFFGMNTSGLFFTDGHDGTTQVFIILLSVTLAAFLSLPLLRFIDRTLLRFFLGRTNIYKKISKQIKEVGDLFRVK